MEKVSVNVRGMFPRPDPGLDFFNELRKNAARLPLGITIKQAIGIGDTVQFSSLPENYFRATGHKLIDESRSWIFDHNPFVDRNPARPPSKTIELWNFGHGRTFEFRAPRKEGRPACYLSNAEIWATAAGVPVVLNRPRLYRFEDFPFMERKKILIQTEGRSHGRMPQHVVKHIIDKYGNYPAIYQIGERPDATLPFPFISTPTLWDLVELISSARMLIGMDSGPAWIAAAYPDVRVKILRSRPTPNNFENWVPLDAKNIHSHWDDRCREIFNPTGHDVGFTQSYLRI